MTPSEVLSGRIRMYRERLGWSLRRLAEECAAVGGKSMTAATIHNIETGRPDETGRRRRDISVDELLLFGRALSVPALLLLVPLGSRSVYPVTSTVSLQPGEVWTSITGQTAPEVPEPCSCCGLPHSA